MKLAVLNSLVRKTFGAWRADGGSRLGAALAYYSVFSIAPLIIIVLAAARLLFGDRAAQHLLVDELKDAVGEPLARAVEWLIVNAGDAGSATTATLVSIGLLLFGASAVFGQLQDALNVIWKVPSSGGSWLGLVLDRFLAFLMVFATGLFMLISLVVTTVMHLAHRRLDSILGPGGGAALWQGANAVVFLLVLTALFAVIYKVLPKARLAWGDVWLGAAVTAALFTVGKYLIGLYLAYGSVASGYGAAGSLVVILVWVYYSSQVFLFGAEFTRVHAESRREAEGAAH
jgi:membrane protein